MRMKKQVKQLNHQVPESLVGLAPETVLQHGPTKRIVDAFIWFDPKVGTISAYTPRPSDLEGHFGVFRGVDMLESFGQGVLVAPSTLLEWQKQECSLEEMKATWNTAVLGLGNVAFHHFLEVGQTFVSIGLIDFHRFRQTVVSGRIYRVPKGLDLQAYFQGLSSADIREFRLREDFHLIAQIEGITCRLLRNSRFTS